MSIRILAISLFMVCAGVVHAQTDQTEQVEEAIEEIQPMPVQTFSVLLYNGPDAMKADSLITAYHEKYPDLERARLNACPPNYSAKVGIFYSRLDGLRLLEKIRDSFPQLLLVPNRDCQ